jgi:hypothetical protein
MAILYRPIQPFPILATRLKPVTFNAEIDKVFFRFSFFCRFRNLKALLKLILGSS